MNPLSIALSVLYAAFMLQFQSDALARLGIGPMAASWLVAATLVGGLVDLPCFFRSHSQSLARRTPGVFGLAPLWSDPWGRPQVQWVAVNVGGFVVPMLISLSALIQLFRLGIPVYLVALIAGVVTAVAHRSAQVDPARGVVMRPLWPALTAAILANSLCPQVAPLVAYSCGVLGVLVGADLLNLARVLRQGTPVVSIGGAGTFDGIVITGIMASLLAGS